MRRFIDRALEPPFWTTVPVFGVHRYPSRLSARILFWVSAIAFSLVYFFFIAFFIVYFSKSLWGWDSPYSSAATTLYDVIYLNWLLVVVFVALEAVLMYRSARHPMVRSKSSAGFRPQRVAAECILFILFWYALLKIFTHSIVVEPNLLPVVSLMFAFLFCIRFLTYRTH